MKEIFTYFKELREKTTHIFAKNNPEITLSQHIADNLAVLNEILKQNVGLIEKRFSAFNVKQIVEALFFTVYFHDIGKATKEFQNTLFNQTQSFHPFYSLMCFNKSPFQFNNIDIPLLAIANHHSIYFSDSSGTLYLNVSVKEPEFLPEVDIFFYFYPKVFQKILGFSPAFIPKRLNNPPQKVKGFILDISRKIKNNGVKIETAQTIKELFILFSGTLVFCDRIASAKEFQLGFNFKYQLDSKESFRTLFEQQIDNFEQWKPFQQQASEIQQSIFIEIPTGEGKTEAAILWAENNLKNTFTRICYTLPTRVTSNKMYDRLSEVFNENNLAIIHSSAKLKLEEEFPDDEKQKLNLWYSILNTFSLPASVSTIDSLLTRYLHIGRWDAALMNLSNALLIVDEIHAYNPKLLGFLLRVLEYQQSLGNSFALMSASFPEVLRRKFEESLTFKFIGNSENEKELWQKVPGEILKRNISIFDAIPDIIKHFKSGKNVLCILNTIRDAKKMYSELESNGIAENHLLLYHSEFIVKDRKFKENEIYYRLGKIGLKAISETILKDKIFIDNSFISYKDFLNALDNNSPFILIATQVVEISLDIDFDVMFTEIAPIDALVQRFGRVNRKKLKRKFAPFFIFSKIDSGTDGWYYPYEKEFLDMTWNTVQEGPFCLDDLKKWVNQVYTLDTTFNNSWFSRSFNSGYSLFDRVLKELNVISKNNLREELAEEFMLREIDKKQRRISVIPMVFWDVFELKHKSFRERLPYTIEIAQYKKYALNGIQEIPGGYGLHILYGKNYSYLKGVDWEGEDKYMI